MSFSFLNSLGNLQIGDLGCKKLIGSLRENDLLVFSPTSFALVKDLTTKAHKLNSRTIGISKQTLDDFCDSKSFRQVISLGNGKTTDIAKYISRRMGVKLISIPSALTTNVFFTDKACLLSGEDKMAFGTKLPDEIMLDFEILDQTAFKYHMYGLCDVLSIHTALSDWKLASQRGCEKIDQQIYKAANSILEEMLAKKNEILLGTHDSLRLIAKLISDSGELTIAAGCGRPESGSEHIIAKFLENRLQIYHAISVSAGMLLVMIAQGNIREEIILALRDFGFLEEITKNKALQKELFNTVTKISPRKDRYTILNEKKINCEEVELILGFAEGKVIAKSNLHFQKESLSGVGTSL